MATKALPENQRRRVELPAKMALLAVLGNAQLSLDAPKWLHLKETLQTLLGGCFPSNHVNGILKDIIFMDPKTLRLDTVGTLFVPKPNPSTRSFPRNEMPRSIDSLSPWPLEPFDQIRRTPGEGRKRSCAFQEDLGRLGSPHVCARIY